MKAGHIKTIIGDLGALDILAEKIAKKHNVAEDALRELFFAKEQLKVEVAMIKKKLEGYYGGK